MSTIDDDEWGSVGPPMPPYDPGPSLAALRLAESHELPPLEVDMLLCQVDLLRLEGSEVPASECDALIAEAHTLECTIRDVLLAFDVLAETLGLDSPVQETNPLRWAVSQQHDEFSTLVEQVRTGVEQIARLKPAASELASTIRAAADQVRGGKSSSVQPWELEFAFLGRELFRRHHPRETTSPYFKSSSPSKGVDTDGPGNTYTKWMCDLLQAAGIGVYPEAVLRRLRGVPHADVHASPDGACASFDIPLFPLRGRRR